MEEQKNKPEVKPVVKGEIAVKKPGLFKKFASVFLRDDIENVGEWLVKDIIVPEVMDGLYSVSRNFVDSVFKRSKKASAPSVSGARVSYSSYYKNSEPSRPQQIEEPSKKEPSVMSYNDVVFKDYKDAEAVLLQLGDLLDVFGEIKVSDFFELADLPSPYTAERYGWKAIGTAKIVRDGDGWSINLPKARLLDP